MTLPQIAPPVAAELEYPDCPICGSDRHLLRYQLPGRYRVVRCLDCGVHYLSPRHTETAMHQAYRALSYFEGGGLGYADTNYAGQEMALRATFRQLLQNLSSRGLAGGDLLEIGCGYGYLLNQAQPFFRRRVGTEFSPEAAQIARGTGAEVFVGGVEQLPPDAMFDCIIATQVIEHVYEPLIFLQQTIRHASPGGHVVLATPDIGGALLKAMGRYWPSFKIPEHVVYFDFRTLDLVMRRAGLENIRRLPYPHAFPLGLIASKFRLRLPVPLGRAKIWVPATTVAAYGSMPRG
jgi:SAM-dependent methyltransferase